MKTYILPSLLAADFGNLSGGAMLAEKSGADELHLDIMDGHFVPNISMGPDVVQMSTNTISIPRNVHLMLTYPDKYVEKFANAGASCIQIHVEADCDIKKCLEDIKQRGIKSGITINPDTEAGAVFEYLPLVDEVLCMSVHPGYGGQSFMPNVLPKLKAIRLKANDLGMDDLRIMVDGGINGETAVECAKMGANAFVAGTFLFKSDDMAAEIENLRKSTELDYGKGLLTT